jgi:predicted ATPase
MPYINNIKIPKPAKQQTEKFPFNIDHFSNGLEFRFNRAVTVFAGENASGKSTFLESLSVKSGFPKQGGVRGQNMLRKSWGLSSHGELVEANYDNLNLSECMSLTWNSKPTKGYFFRSEYMSETMSLHLNARDLLTCSHGEGIIELISRFRDGLFILDEPESALSPTSLLALAALIHENSKKYNAQYIIVTHNPILMAIPDSDFYWVGNGRFESMSYKNSPHFTISKLFYDNPDRLMSNVLND